MKYIESIKKRLNKAINKRKYRDLNFAFVANNCWAAEVYKLYVKEFNTPFIGLYILAPDYIKLLENFDTYMNTKLEFVENKDFNFPIGRLNDVEIHFMHYHSEEEARDKWERRTKRFLEFKAQNPDQVFFKMCDRDGGTAELLRRFHNTKHKNKISFSIQENSIESENHFIFTEKKDGPPTNGLGLFYITLPFYKLSQWLKTGKLEKTRKYKLLSGKN